jgi:AmiR/NasT family two-component response regulator
MTRPTLLIIEDRSPVEGGLFRAIQKNNIANESLITCSHEEARDYLNAPLGMVQAVRPTLVLLSSQGADEDTTQLVREITSRLGEAAPAIVAFVTSSDPEAYREYRRAGVSSVVFTPDDPRKKDDLVCDVLSYWLLMDGGAAMPKAL